MKLGCDSTKKINRAGWFAAAWLAALVIAAAMLSLVASPAHADGGGWPTATPTIQVAVPLVVTPQTGKDVLPVLPTPTVQGAAPLPGDQSALPGASIQADQSNLAPAPPSDAVQSRSINWRMLAIGGGIVAGILLVLFLFFRLRA